MFKSARTVLFGAIIALTSAASMASAATYSYVGSWQLGQGPRWSTSPAVLTGQETAALLFGGTARDYVISTISALVADIDFTTWVDTYAAPAAKVAQNAANGGVDGLYNRRGKTSAYVQDHYGYNGRNFGPENYAFRIAAVPLPATGLLLIAGIGGLGALGRRKAARSKSA